MRAAGVKRGDRVGGVLPNIPESVVAMLATTSIGALWSSCSPDFGLQGVRDRRVLPFFAIRCLQAGLPNDTYLGVARAVP